MRAHPHSTGIEKRAVYGAAGWGSPGAGNSRCQGRGRGAPSTALTPCTPLVVPGNEAVPVAVPVSEQDSGAGQQAHPERPPC